MYVKLKIRHRLFHDWFLINHDDWSDMLEIILLVFMYLLGNQNLMYNFYTDSLAYDKSKPK